VTMGIYAYATRSDADVAEAVDGLLAQARPVSGEAGVDGDVVIKPESAPTD
jgi:hypothetical protein